MDSRGHVLLVAFPAQGHLNPSLQFANRLTNIGIQVTFVTSIYAQRRIAKPQARLTIVPFSDGCDDGFNIKSNNNSKYLSELRKASSETLTQIIITSSKNGRPVTRLVYTLLLPWAADVATQFHIPSTLLWIQPAAVLNIYFHYFNGFKDQVLTQNSLDLIQFPGVPLLLSQRDLPSFLLTSSPDEYSFALQIFKEQIEKLTTKTKVLVNTFDLLEPDALKGTEHYDLIAVGPLFIDNSFIGADLYDNKADDDYIQWLDSKNEASVIYVSFGSLLRLTKPQMEEIAKGLLECDRPFLWVIRESGSNEDDDNEYLSCLDKLGKVVTWCSQLDVLRHSSLGCFVTHCGWNSTLESISCGVPIVAFPQWTDQGTNAKLIEDLWGSGVRVRVNDYEENNRFVESGEIRRCIEQVMDGGEKSRELRKKAKEWSVLASEAMREDGTSDNNLKAFFQDHV